VQPHSAQSTNPAQGDRFFGVYENSLPAGFCSAVVQRFDADPDVTQGRVGNGTREGAFDPKIKNTTEIDLNGSRPDWKSVNDVLLGSLNRYLRRYMTEWGRAFNCSLVPEPLKIARYPVGGHFEWHSDNLGNGVTTRVITVLWYLNTVTEGGETEYPWQDMAVKPVEGRLLLCPVGWSYVHRGAPPVSNPKYIAITQLHQQASDHV
jgi:hypothetical protein